MRIPYIAQIVTHIQIVTPFRPQENVTVMSSDSIFFSKYSEKFLMINENHKIFFKITNFIIRIPLKNCLLKK